MVNVAGINVGDVVIFRNEKTKDVFVGKVLNIVTLSYGQAYRMRFLEGCTDEAFIGTTKKLDFVDNEDVKVISIRKFAERFEQEEMEKYLALCHFAVDINDKAYFEECHANYTYWGMEYAKAQKEAEGV